DIPSLNNLTVYDYYENMEELYKQADIVVSRSGSGTVNEILAFGKYAVFVPYPYAVSNHQFYNVKWLYDLGLCEIVEEKDLTEEILKEKINQSFSKDLLKLHQEIKKYSILNSVDKIVESF
ncbi:MAG: glycosyltransferase, partial [Sulfurihydrogenibium azorense]